MPTLTHEQMETPIIHVARARLWNRISKRTKYGISIGATWLIASGAVSLSENAPTSAQEKKLLPGIVQVGFNAVADHPYRIIVGLKDLAADAIDGRSVKVVDNSEDSAVAPAGNAPAGTLPTIGTTAPTPAVPHTPAAEVTQESFNVNGKYPYGVLRTCGLLPKGGFPTDPVEQEVALNNQWSLVLAANEGVELPATATGGILPNVEIVCPTT